MMNRVVALLAHYERLTTLRNHGNFPRSFTFQVFDFVHMEDFIGFAVRRAAQLANSRFQTLFKRCSRIAVSNRRVTDNVRGSLRFLTFGVFGKITALASRFCFIRNPPTPIAILKFSLDFGNGAFVLRRKRFQATVFHEVPKIAQLAIVAGKPIVVADSPQFGVKRRL